MRQRQRRVGSAWRSLVCSRCSPPRSGAADAPVDAGVSATVTVRAPRAVDLLGSLTYLGSAGNFSFRALDPAPGSPAGATVEQTRSNNAFDAVEGLARAGFTLAPGLRLDLTSDTFYKGQGVPGIETNQSPDAALNQTRAGNYVCLASTDLLADRLDLASTSCHGSTAPGHEVDSIRDAWSTGRP